MSEIMVFTNEEFGNVRTVEVNGEPWLVGKDVAVALQYKNPQEAIRNHVDDEDKGVSEILTPGGKQNVPIINESGFISLVLSSKMPKAKQYKRWVTSEVLPSIRKHGIYATGDFLEKSIVDPDYAIRILQALKKEREEKQALTEENAAQKQMIAEMKPKVTYCQIVLECKDAIPIRVIAKDYGWSANRMNEYLHQRGVQYKQGGTWLLYQKYAEYGYTKSETAVYGNEGEMHPRIHTKWTQSGRLFIYDLLKADGIYPNVEKEEKEEQMKLEGVG